MDDYRGGGDHIFEAKIDQRWTFFHGIYESYLSLILYTSLDSLIFPTVLNFMDRLFTYNVHNDILRYL